MMRLVPASPASKDHSTAPYTALLLESRDYLSVQASFGSPGPSANDSASAPSTIRSPAKS